MLFYNANRDDWKRAVNMSNHDGDTPLISAAYWNHLQTVRVLLDCGADMTIRGQGGKTARQFAEEQGHTKVKQIFRKKQNETKKITFPIPTPCDAKTDPDSGSDFEEDLSVTMSDHKSATKQFKASIGGDPDTGSGQRVPNGSSPTLCQLQFAIDTDSGSDFEDDLIAKVGAQPVIYRNSSVCATKTCQICELKHSRCCWCSDSRPLAPW